MGHFTERSRFRFRFSVDDPYYCGMRAKVSSKEPTAAGKMDNANTLARKMTTLMPSRTQKMRKSQSTSYLSFAKQGSLYSERSSFYPGSSNQYSVGECLPNGAAAKKNGANDFSGAAFDRSARLQQQQLLCNCCITVAFSCAPLLRASLLFCHYKHHSPTPQSRCALSLISLTPSLSISHSLSPTLPA